MTVATFRPNGDSGTQGLAIFPASPTTHYDKVDEAVLDTGDGVYSYNDPSYIIDRYTLVDHTAESGAISNVTIKAVCQGTGYVKLGVKIGARDYGLTQQALTGSPVTYSQSFDTNPATSVAWTWSDIDALIAVVQL